MPTKAISNRKNSIFTLRNIIFTLFCVLLAYAPFFRGLYFEKELLPTHVLSFSMALVWMVSKYKKKEYKLINSPVDITAIGIVFMYFITIFYAVDTRLAILELLKYANYIFIFLLARDLSKNDTYKKWILNTLVISAVGVSIVGIGSFIGTWNYNGAIMGERIASTFQYPNTLASYLGAVFIIAMGLFITEKNRIYKLMYSIAANIMLFTFILTYSRGMWLMLPFALLLFVIAIPNRKKLELILILFSNSIVAVGFAMRFSQISESSNNIQWLTFVMEPLIIAGITFLMSLISNKIKNITIDTKKILIFIIIVTIIFGSGIFYAFTQTAPLNMENTSNDDSWTTLYRNVSSIESDKEYTITVKYDASNKGEKPYAGRVRVYSLDQQSKLGIIKTEHISDLSKDQIQIDFITLKDTDKIRVYFDNYYTGTSLTLSEVKIIDVDNDRVIEDIKLKYKYISESIIRRINSFSMNDNSAQARFTFYSDGFKVIKDYLLGTGGGGWKRLYTKYQSYGYTSAQAHNYFLKIWIEVGLIGLLMFLSFLSLLTYYIFKKWLTSEDDKMKSLIVAIFMAVMLILAHSFMDFDLSLAALSFVLWGLMGILSSYITYDSKSKTKKHNSDKSKRSKTIAVIVLTLLLINSASISLGNILAKNAVEASGKGDTEKAIEGFKNAAILDPYKAEYKADIATLLKSKYQQTQDKEHIIEAVKQIDQAHELGKYNLNIITTTASFYLSIGQIDKGLILVNDIIDLQPMKVENYLQKSDVYLKVSKYYLEQKQDSDKAREVINEAYNIKNEIDNINKIATKPLVYNEDLLYNIGYIQYYKENFDNNQYVAGNNYAIDFAYYFDLDIDSNGNLDMLRQWNSENGRVAYEQLKEETSNYIRIRNEGETYGFIYSYGLKLIPDTNYKVFVKARGTTKDETGKLLMMDNKAENRVQGRLDDIELSEDWRIIQLQLKTYSDITPGTQYLRIHHGGNDDGYVDIEEILIFKEVK